jgi:hypothetical protein
VNRGTLDPIRAQILWNRLLAVVEEQAQTLVRTAFSTTVREAGDLSAGVFDRRGRMLAQAVTGTPGHVRDGRQRRVLPASILSTAFGTETSGDQRLWHGHRTTSPW